ncbi:1204_t:CDS:2, partial [Scutellospora calospora]
LRRLQEHVWRRLGLGAWCCSFRFGQNLPQPQLGQLGSMAPHAIGEKDAAYRRLALQHGHNHKRDLVEIRAVCCAGAAPPRRYLAM